MLTHSIQHDRYDDATRRAANAGCLPGETLTDRDLEILALLAEGASNRKIGATLYLAEGTVKNYVSVIYAKLGVERRTQAAVFAYRAGITEARH